jgi:acetyl esterase/lipase
MDADLGRRRFLEVAAASSGSLLFGRAGAAPISTPQTFTYKKAGDLEIKADVYRPADDLVRPVAVWIHGGALIMGDRASVPQRVHDMLLDAGYVVVSIDYRLAPETMLPQIIEDVEDAFRWVREKGPGLFHGDASRLVVLGGSAGGYLTLVTGYRVKPRPAVLVSLWGYGDLVGDWYSTPSPHQRHHQSKMTKEEAYRQVSGPAVSDARDRKGDGGAFYQYCRQQGTWPKAVSGWDPRSEVQKFVPYMPERNVTKDYPPTILIHGTADTDVPYEQSVIMAERFQEHGVEHELVSIPNGEHGLVGGDPKLIDAAYESALAFVKRHRG